MNVLKKNKNKQKYIPKGSKHTCPVSIIAGCALS
jgi:hypothetical protein